MIIDSSKDYLLFEGETRIHLSCDKLNRSWIPFNSYVDPDNVIIDLKTDKKRTRKKPLYSGILLGANGYYPSVLGHSKKIKDYELLGAGGYINYDEYDRAYVIASKKKKLKIDQHLEISLFIILMNVLFTQKVKLI